jgi:hypothetical protein
MYAPGDERGDGAIEGGVSRATEREGGDGRAASGASLGRDVVEAGDDVGVCAGASVAQDLNSDNVGALGNTILGASNSASAMGTMTVAVGVGVTAEGSTLLSWSVFMFIRENCQNGPNEHAHRK